MTHPLFTPEMRLLLEEDNEVALNEALSALHPATIAEALTDEFSVEEMWRILGRTGLDHQAGIFEYFPLEWQVEMVEGTGRPHMARLIEEMSSDDRADLLRRLPQPVTESLLRLVDEADRRDIASLVEYDEGTAGSIMTTDYAWLPETITTAEALERLRLQAPDKETIYYVYVLNEQRKLLGVASLRDIILKPRSALLREVMEEQLVAVRPTDDRERVAQEIARYDLLALPVLDDEGRLLGIVTHDDVIDVMVSEATEDVQRFGGLGVITEDYLEASFLKVWQKRAIWLALLFIGQMFTFNALAHFENELSRILVLSMFVPLLISTGGNSGSQGAALLTRALALGQASTGEWRRILRHEVLMGLALGVTLGVLALARTYWLTPRHLLPQEKTEELLGLLSITVSLSVAAICLWGTLVGSMLPLFFKKIGVDPGIASGPFVATFVDVTGIFIYLTLARLLFGSLLTG